jgi:hypothetical protein
MHDPAARCCPICPGFVDTTLMHERSVAQNRAMRTDDALLDARARVLADLTATGAADAVAVSLLEDALGERRWWAAEWPEGAAYVAGQVAQDLQDALFDEGIARWPLCRLCEPEEEPHELRISPELGPDPTWVCEHSGQVAGPLGSL